MKNIFTIGVLIVGGIALAFFARTYERNTPRAPIGTAIPEQSSPSTLMTGDGTFCFVHTHIATKDAPYSSTEHARITRTGNSITGTKYGTQSGPDMSNGYTGILKGTITGNTITTLFTYTVEGSEGTEQEEYEISKTQLIKHHYQLKDSHGILIPDKTKTEREGLAYEVEVCK